MLGRRALEILIALIALAREAGSLRVRFRATQLAQLLCENPPDGGRWYSDFKRTLRCLASVEVKVMNSRTYRFVDEWHLDGNTNTVLLNRTALGITAQWIEGGLSEEECRQGYISYPLAYLKAPATETEKSFHDYLLRLPINSEVRAATLARKGCGFSLDMMKRLRVVRHALYKHLQAAVERGHLEEFKFTALYEKSWQKTWRVELERHQQRRGQNQRELTESEEQLAAEVFDWHKRPSHDLYKDDATIRGWIHNAIRSKGEAAVRHAYKSWALCGYPSIHKFWEELGGGKGKLTQSSSSSGEVTG